MEGMEKDEEYENEREGRVCLRGSDMMEQKLRREETVLGRVAMIVQCICIVR
jgi:hypothetical protein